MNTIYLFLISLIVFGILDAIWLAGIMANSYRKLLSPIGIFGPDGKFAPRILPVVVVYIAIVAGFMIFILPIVKDLSAMGAFVYGAIFGIIVYAIYEFTNYAGLKDWPKKLVTLDTIWGGILFGTASIVIPEIAKMLNILG